MDADNTQKAFIELEQQAFSFRWDELLIAIRQRTIKQFRFSMFAIKRSDYNYGVKWLANRGIIRINTGSSKLSSLTMDEEQAEASKVMTSPQAKKRGELRQAILVLCFLSTKVDVFEVFRSYGYRNITVAHFEMAFGQYKDDPICKDWVLRHGLAASLRQLINQSLTPPTIAADKRSSDPNPNPSILINGATIPTLAPSTQVVQHEFQLPPFSPFPVAETPQSMAYQQWENPNEQKYSCDATKRATVAYNCYIQEQSTPKLAGSSLICLDYNVDLGKYPSLYSPGLNQAQGFTRSASFD